eukprot:1068955-Karenia_brevis.AAC.1
MTIGLQTIVEYTSVAAFKDVDSGFIVGAPDGGILVTQFLEQKVQSGHLEWWYQYGYLADP